MEAGRPVDVAVSGVASDSVGARCLGDLAFAALEEEPPISVLVNGRRDRRGSVDAVERVSGAVRAGAAAAYAALL